MNTSNNPYGQMQGPERTGPVEDIKILHDFMHQRTTEVLIPSVNLLDTLMARIERMSVGRRAAATYFEAGGKAASSWKQTGIMHDSLAIVPENNESLLSTSSMKVDVDAPITAQSVKPNISENMKVSPNSYDTGLDVESLQRTIAERAIPTNQMRPGIVGELV